MQKQVLDIVQAIYCFAKQGEEYVVYLRYAGGIKVDLKPSSADDTFEYYWFDPGSGKYYQSKEIKGGDVHYFSAPESYPGVKNFKDWFCISGENERVMESGRVATEANKKPVRFQKPHRF